tara:strand:+ start:250 stop:471 length:222 start_codon:yes stop_codon:yes gene_type:complete
MEICQILKSVLDNVGEVFENCLFEIKEMTDDCIEKSHEANMYNFEKHFKMRRESIQETESMPKNIINEWEEIV